MRLLQALCESSVYVRLGGDEACQKDLVLRQKRPMRLGGDEARPKFLPVCLAPLAHSLSLTHTHT